MPTMREAAIQVLQEYPAWLHYETLMKTMLERNLIQTEWQHPERTINSILSQDVKIFWEQSTFMKHPLQRWVYLLNNNENRQFLQQNELIAWNDTTTLPVIIDEDVYNNEENQISNGEEARTTENNNEVEIQELPWYNATSQQKGKGGEMAVSSELLFHGFNTSIPNVDDGIDIIGFKNDTFYYFQVKTSLNVRNYYPFRIREDSFNRFNQNRMYYVFVMRKDKKNEYLIIHNNIISFLISNNHITLSSNHYYCINIQYSNDIWTLWWFDVTANLNNWGLIA
jgi:hypothetical protein